MCEESPFEQLESAGKQLIDKINELSEKVNQQEIEIDFLAKNKQNKYNVKDNLVKTTKGHLCTIYLHEKLSIELSIEKDNKKNESDEDLFLIYEGVGKNKFSKLIYRDTFQNCIQHIHEYIENIVSNIKFVK